MSDLVDSLIAPKTDIAPKNPKQFSSIAGHPVTPLRVVIRLHRLVNLLLKTKGQNKSGQIRENLLKRKKFKFGKSNKYKIKSVFQEDLFIKIIQLVIVIKEKC